MKRNFRVTLILLTMALLAQPQTAQAKLPAGLAGTLSVVPGLGQVTNGDVIEGFGWFLTVVSLASVPGYARLIAFDLWGYNIYDAYRDAGPKVKRYKDHNLFVNYIATYNPLNIWDPIGAPMLIGYGVLPTLRTHHYKPELILYTSFVGLGEESLFRGFLFPAFSDLWGSKFFGALTSSVLFGAAHTQYNLAGKATVGLLGMIFCWQLNHNEYDLRKNIFTHSWIDFFLIPNTASSSAIRPFSKPEPRQQQAVQPGLRFNFLF